MTPKFIQIATSAYSLAHYSGHIQLFGLTAEGDVYEWQHSKYSPGGEWVQLKNPDVDEGPLKDP